MPFEIKIPDKAARFLLYNAIASAGCTVVLVIMKKYLREDIERVGMNVFNCIFIFVVLVWVPSTIASGGWGIIKLIQFLNSKKA